MKKNLYYRTVLKRENVIGLAFQNFFLSIASYPRLILEVFIRKNFGQRYFSFASILTAAFILIFFPLLISWLFPVRGYRADPFDDFWTKYLSWYLFTAAFIIFSLLRAREVNNNPSVFDFAKFSLYQGDINPFFYKIQFFDTKPDVRTIEIIYEPAIFLIAGFVLMFSGQNIGILITLASFCYSFSYSAAYAKGDSFVMDKIDEMILNEQMENAFVDDENGPNSKGVTFRMEKPTSQEMRRKVAETMLEEEEETDLAV